MIGKNTQLNHLFSVLEKSPTIQAHFEDINPDALGVNVMSNTLFKAIFPKALATYNTEEKFILFPQKLLDNPVCATYCLAHEARHLWQDRNGMMDMMTSDMEIHGALYLQCFIEADANAFAVTVIEELKDEFSEDDWKKWTNSWSTIYGALSKVALERNKDHLQTGLSAYATVLSFMNAEALETPRNYYMRRMMGYLVNQQVKLNKFNSDNFVKSFDNVDKAFNIAAGMPYKDPDGNLCERVDYLSTERSRWSIIGMLGEWLNALPDDIATTAKSHQQTLSP